MVARNGFRSTAVCLLACSLVWPMSARSQAAPPPDPAGDPSSPAQQEMDRLLNMDINDLSNVSVMNPVVEGVSKKEETLSESPGIVDVITAQDIEQFGARNLYQVLEWATSVYMTGSFLFPRNVASIRGNLQNHEDNHVLILINGRPFRDITLGGINVSIYTAFPIHMIERIEVIRGPGSVLYGTNAFNGVINIVTKVPDQPTMYASVLSGSYGWRSYSAAVGNGTQSESIYGGATYSRSTGWDFSATEDPGAPPPLDSDTAPWGEDNIGIFASYRNCGFTANLFVARATEEILGPDGAWPSDRLVDPRVFLDLGYLFEIDDWQSLQTNFTYNYDGTHFESVVPGAQFVAPSYSYLVEGTYRAELTDDLDFMLGGLVDFHHGRAAIVGVADSIPTFNEIWYGTYMQMEYQANDWLRLVGGMQGNMPGEIKGGIVPRAAVIASLSEDWTAKFLYGQAFRSPYQAERSINVPGILIGNPDLIPEKIQTFDFQLCYHTEDFRLAATWFHSDYWDIITRSSTLPQTYSNSGSMTFDGVELENEWEITKCWRWLGSLTYQDNVRGNIHNTTGVPNWMAKMGIAYHDPCSGWNIGLFDTYFGDPIVPDTAAILNEQPRAIHLMSLNMTLDLDRRLCWRTGRKMQLQFLIQNLLDEDIQHIEFERELINSFPAGPGRQFYGGFTMAY